METNQFQRTKKTMTGSRHGHSTGPITTFSWIAACLLILLGVAFELGMLGFGPYNSSGAWLFSVIGKNGWIMLADLAVPELRELAKIWPLMLITVGSAILLVIRRQTHFNFAAASNSMSKENNGN
jgi:hypothetical protein